MTKEVGVLLPKKMLLVNLQTERGGTKNNKGWAKGNH